MTLSVNPFRGGNLDASLIDRLGQAFKLAVWYRFN
jgi:hypothetical protein